MPKTAVIILNYNNCQATEECLSTFCSINSAPAKVIVVDNASAPDQREALSAMLSEKFPECILIQSESNVGYAQGNNLGLQTAYADPAVDNVLILNNDIIWTSDILPDLLAIQSNLKDVGIISPVLMKPGNIDIDTNCARRAPRVRDLIQRHLLHYWWRARGLRPEQVQKHLYLLSHDRQNKNSVLEVELPSGSCMLITKNLMQRIGGFDPYTFLYYEENILYKKLQALGKRNYVCLNLSCIHVGAATTTALPSSFFVMRHSVRSAKYYLKNYAKASWLQRLAYNASAVFFLMTFRIQKFLSGKKK